MNLKKLTISLALVAISGSIIHVAHAKDVAEVQKNSSAPYAKAQNGFTSVALNGYAGRP
jgi:hypothetical protein